MDTAIKLFFQFPKKVSRLGCHIDCHAYGLFYCLYPGFGVFIPFYPLLGSLVQGDYFFSLLDILTNTLFFRQGLLIVLISDRSPCSVLSAYQLFRALVIFEPLIIEVDCLFKRGFITLLFQGIPLFIVGISYPHINIGKGLGKLLTLWKLIEGRTIFFSCLLKGIKIAAGLNLLGLGKKNIYHLVFDLFSNRGYFFVFGVILKGHIQGLKSLF